MLESELRSETLKWLEKAAARRMAIEPAEGREEFIKNIDAYIADARHFLAKNDLIRSFEAVIWAWAWLEILERLGAVKEQNF